VILNKETDRTLSLSPPGEFYKMDNKSCSVN